MKDWIKDLFFGYLFGIANIIPGVSGGTFALVFGFYERLLGILNSINGQTIKELLAHLIATLKRQTNAKQNLQAFMLEKDLYFGIRLGLGAVVAIISLSALMKYLLKDHFSITYAFFFGLIIMSVKVPWMQIQKKASLSTLGLFLGIFLTVFVCISVNPVDKALKKSEVYSQVTEVKETQKLSAFSYSGKYTLNDFILLAISGAIAVSAMVLPGVSGSLVLIMLGQYFTVITAIANLKALLLDDIFMLGLFAVGMALGMLVISRIVAWSLKKFHDFTMYLLTGLIAGSFYALWPFKERVVVDLYEKSATGIQLVKGKVLYSNQNFLPELNTESIIVIVVALLGAFTMYFLEKLES